MGFGLIFLGWITLLFFRAVPIGILGCYLMSKGLAKLCGYSDYFKKALYACYVFLGSFIVFGVLWVLEYTEIFSYSKYEYARLADAFVYNVAFIAFSYFLYKGLGDISGAVGFEKGKRREKFCISLLAVNSAFFVADVILQLTGTLQVTSMPLFLMEFFRIAYSAIYIYSCYMMIATQEIIDEEERKIREYDEKYSFRQKKK